MVRKFLRLFAYVRGLEADLARVREANQEQYQEKLRLEDRLEAAVADRGKLWDTLQECLRGERAAYQMHVNQAWQKMGGGVPYPDAPHLSPAAVPKQQEVEPVGRRRILPSEAVARKTSQYIDNLVSRGVARGS